MFNYHPSLEDALKSAYPKKTWDSNKFAATKRNLKDLDTSSEQGEQVIQLENTKKRKRTSLIPQGYWQDKSNIIQALASAEQQLGIEKVYKCSFIQSKLIDKISQRIGTQSVWQICRL